MVSVEFEKQFFVDFPGCRVNQAEVVLVLLDEIEYICESVYSESTGTESPVKSGTVC